MFWLTTRQLKSGSLNSRKKAARELWRERDPRALDALATAALNDPDTEIRQIAASALGRLQVPGRLGPLIQALGDKSSDVIKSALIGLRSARDERVIHGLGPLLPHLAFEATAQIG